MTIFRCSLLLAALTASAGAAPSPAHVGQTAKIEDCSNISPMVERECAGKRIAAKERRLAATYRRAMRAVRKNFARHGHWDRRSDPVYLTRSQAAWKQYVDNDCKVQASFGGGSNSSISDREMECYEDALDKRLELLRQIADKTLNVG